MTRTRTIGLAVAALALVATAALPSPANASRKAHLLKLYKVEKHLDLEGQDQTYSVTCPNNDLALDGMWRVDDVGQDPDYYGDDLPGGSWSTTQFPPDHSDWDLWRSLRPVKVARFDDSRYDFEFNPQSGGDVSMKLWVTCLGWKTEPNSHTVSWVISPGGSMVITDNALHSTAGACGTGEIVVQPSFHVTAGDADLVASYPSSNDTEWNWRFDNPINAFSATVSWKCLHLKSQLSTDSTHKHRIVRMMANKFTPANAVKPLGVDERQAICGEHYKGMIGGWDYSAHVDFTNVPGLNTDYLYFLGMDPRIKHRAFKFLNQAAVQKVPTLYLVCFKDKTT